MSKVEKQYRKLSVEESAKYRIKAVCKTYGELWKQSQNRVNIKQKIEQLRVTAQFYKLEVYLDQIIEEYIPSLKSWKPPSPIEKKKQKGWIMEGFYREKKRKKKIKIDK